jgi:hypothetical protein
VTDYAVIKIRRNNTNPQSQSQSPLYPTTFARPGLPPENKKRERRKV